MNYNSTEDHSELTKASPMAPLKQFVSVGYFFFNYNIIFLGGTMCHNPGTWHNCPSEIH